MNTFEQFKEGANSINTLRREVVTEMDNLANNIFSSLNQANFSIKLIADTKQFISKYIDDEASFKERLKISLTEITSEEITLDMYNNMAFNSSFISSFSFFENFFRILAEAFSYYLASSPGQSTLIRAVYNNFCKLKFIQDD
jgi:hypothetical protein